MKNSIAQLTGFVNMKQWNRPPLRLTAGKRIFLFAELVNKMGVIGSVHAAVFVEVIAGVGNNCCNVNYMYFERQCCTITLLHMNRLNKLSLLFSFL